MSATPLRIALTLLAFGLAGCGSPLVGTECKPGLIRVGDHCEADCEAPLVSCPAALATGYACADLTVDTSHCGACNRECLSGVCNDGTCDDAIDGHVFVIGDDLMGAPGAAWVLVGNALLMPRTQFTRILTFVGDATARFEATIDAYTLNAYRHLGRKYSSRRGDGDRVPALLDASDVLIICPQVDAEDAALDALGAAWAPALELFIARSGVIVLFDAVGKNSGTHRILDAAGLFSAKGRVALTAHTLELVAPGDAVATGVSKVYQSRGGLVGFDTSEQTVVVRERESGLPVVLHVTH